MRCRLLVRSALAVAVAGGALAATLPAAPAAAQISCASGYQTVQIGGEWTCILATNDATTTVNGPPLQVEVSGNGSYEPYCEDPHGLYPPGYGGAPAGMVPCHIDDLGWFDGTNCYYIHDYDDPPDPEPGMEGYEEHGADGLVYDRRCAIDDTVDNQNTWGSHSTLVLPEPPPFEGGEPPSVLVAWEDAVNQLVLGGPEIATAPPDGVALVRLPVWFWDEGPSSDSASATAGVNTVSATATVSEIRWDPGDGEAPLPCGQGIAYEPELDLFGSDCLHQYLRPSRTEAPGTFQLVATTTWHLQWSINGEPDGELFLEAASAVDLQIDELQVLTGRP